MKKILLASVLSVFAFSAFGQSIAMENLSINQVKATVNADGDLFWDKNTAHFEIPTGSGKHTIFAGNMWIGGLDTGGQLHLAGQVYRQMGNDFYQGPVMNSANYSSTNDQLWNQLWKINRTTIDSFVLWTISPSSYPNYVIPSIIMNWPGNGDVQQGQTPRLLPYVDVNGDNIYNAQSGDYPCIKGDQAVFFLFNDDRGAHGETGGQKLRIQVVAMMYGYHQTNSPLDTTVFLEYNIANLSGMDYHDVYLGNWTDFDLGDYSDDYIGCDVARAMYYVYNGRANDGGNAQAGQGTYGANPPAQGVLYLQMPDAPQADGIDNDQDGTVDEVGEQVTMNFFHGYNNDFTTTGNPSTAADYYNYLQSRWIDNSFVTYGGNGFGGNTPAKYAYPGVSDPMGWGTNMTPQAPWDEAIAGNAYGDRRGLGAAGPFHFSANQTLRVTYAYVYGRGTSGPAGSIAVMQQDADSVRSYFNTHQFGPCNPVPTGIQATNNTIQISAMPNPAEEYLLLNYLPKSTTAKYQLIDVTGRVVLSATFVSGNRQEISLAGLPSGMYLLRVQDGETSGATRVIKR